MFKEFKKEMFIPNSKEIVQHAQPVELKYS